MNFLFLYFYFYKIRFDEIYKSQLIRNYKSFLFYNQFDFFQILLQIIVSKFKYSKRQNKQIQKISQPINQLIKSMKQQKQFENLSFNNQSQQMFVFNKNPDQKSSNLKLKNIKKQQKDNLSLTKDYQYRFMEMSQNYLKLQQKVKQLEDALQKQKQKTTQLQKRNQQLMDMLVSASQSSVKRNQQFVQLIQRKICNFKAINDFSSSKYKSTQSQFKSHKSQLNGNSNYLKTQSSQTYRQSSRSPIKMNEYNISKKFKNMDSKKNLLNYEAMKDKQNVNNLNQEQKPNKQGKSKQLLDIFRKENEKNQFNNQFNIGKFNKKSREKELGCYSKMQNKNLKY